MVLLALPPPDYLWTNVCARVRDAAVPPGASAQTRMVSVARIRLVSRKSTRLFKGIICDVISEFESLPGSAVSVRIALAARSSLLIDRFLLVVSGGGAQRSI